MRLGIDTGGTFTDFVWLDKNGRLQIHKQLSTPQAPAEAILTGVDTLSLPPHTTIVHGTTVATNALLERRGSRTALITTAGFADILAIGRQNRPDIYALVPQKPRPLVPHTWRFTVSERVTAQGDILTPLNLDNLPAILTQMATDQVESVAICLLFSFLYPHHEQKIREAIQTWQHQAENSHSPLANLHISLSSDILPEYREYERTTTTVINAYVAPLISQYLQHLSAGIAPRSLTIMQSNGGIINADTASKQAARTALSGPAGGVVGARFVAAQAGLEGSSGFRQIITLDMGGTSTDVALCPGHLPTTAFGKIADMPLRLPIIDIHTVGAGGGSLAYIDAGGALHVGPQSAGAVPGPACYTQTMAEWLLAIESNPRLSHLRQPMVTTTDANLVLGRLDPQHFLGGTMPLNEAAARSALADLAQAMAADTPEMAAWDVIRVANTNMERAIRHISVERGYDPRGFTLVAFGGAGPLHACELARNLQIPRVLIPTVPGVLSALGMLTAAPTKDYSQTVMHTIMNRTIEIGTWLEKAFAPLIQRALTEMETEGHRSQDITLHRALDMRYVGQSHELTVSYLGESLESTLTELFHIKHNRRYGYQQTTAIVEIVNLRLTAVAPVTSPHLTKYSPSLTADATEAQIGQKIVWFDQQPWTTPLYERAKLRSGHQWQGPAIIFQYDTTTVIPPNWQATVDPYGNLILTS